MDKIFTIRKLINKFCAGGEMENLTLVFNEFRSHYFNPHFNLRKDQINIHNALKKIRKIVNKSLVFGCLEGENDGREKSQLLTA